MKWIVFLILVSNTVIAQDILLPRKVVESCRENYNKIGKLESIIESKDSIINLYDAMLN
jgi:hypothetical protein